MYCIANNVFLTTQKQVDHDMSGIGRICIGDCCFYVGLCPMSGTYLKPWTVRRSAVDQEDLKPYWKSEEKKHISLSDQLDISLYILLDILLYKLDTWSANYFDDKIYTSKL